MSSVSMHRTVEIDVHRDHRWADFVSHHPGALIYHHPNWLAVLEREYQQKCIGLACEDQSGGLKAILPLFYSEGLPFRVGRRSLIARYCSSPRTPVTGPLAVDDASMTAILSQAIDLIRRGAGLQLEIKSYEKSLGALVPELTSVSWGSTYVEELPAEIDSSRWEDFCESVRFPRECGPCNDCKQLRFGNARKQHRVTWAVNKAVNLGLQVREAESEVDVRQWYRLYLESMRYHSFPPRPLRFFLDLWSTLQPKGQMRLLVAERSEKAHKRMIAGSIFLRFGQTVFYAFTGCAHRDLQLHPHDIIQLESIRDSCRNGFRWYDFGEATEHQGLAQFKAKWGTETRPLYRYYYPGTVGSVESKASSVVSLLRRGWRTLPLGLTATLGEKLHRYM